MSQVIEAAFLTELSSLLRHELVPALPESPHNPSTYNARDSRLDAWEHLAIEVAGLSWEVNSGVATAIKTAAAPTLTCDWKITTGKWIHNMITQEYVRETTVECTTHPDVFVEYSRLTMNDINTYGGLASGATAVLQKNEDQKLVQRIEARKALHEESVRRRRS